MKNSKITLNEAVKFHGHLGSYLVLGILMGELALKKLAAHKYFGIQVKVWGVNKKPKSCFIDGLQLSTGATYGKGNIQKISGNRIKALFRNEKNNHKIEIYLTDGVEERLSNLKGHKDSEAFARELYETGLVNIFRLKADG